MQNKAPFKGQFCLHQELKNTFFNERAFYCNTLFGVVTQVSKAISSTALPIWSKQKPGVMDIAQHSHLETEEQLLVQGHILRIVFTNQVLVVTQN